MYVCVKARGWHCESFSIILLLSVWDRVSHEPGACWSSYPSFYQAPGILPSCLPSAVITGRSCTDLLFYVRADNKLRSPVMVGQACFRLSHIPRSEEENKTQSDELQVSQFVSDGVEPAALPHCPLQSAHLCRVGTIHLFIMLPWQTPLDPSVCQTWLSKFYIISPTSLFSFKASHFKFFSCTAMCFQVTDGQVSGGQWAVDTVYQGMRIKLCG